MGGKHHLCFNDRDTAALDIAERQAAMTSQEIVALIRKTIIESLEANNRVERGDLLRAHIRGEWIDQYFRSTLIKVIEERGGCLRLERT